MHMYAYIYGCLNMPPYTHTLTLHINVLPEMLSKASNTHILTQHSAKQRQNFSSSLAYSLLVLD